MKNSGKIYSTLNNKIHTFDVKDEYNRKLRFEFKYFLDKSLAQPTLMIFPYSKLGLLLIGVEVSRCSLVDVVNGVEHLSQIELTSHELMIFNYRFFRLNDDGEDKPVMLRVSYKDIDKDPYTAFYELLNNKRNDSYSLCDLCKKLLNHVNTPSLQLKVRTHPFTYAQFNDADKDDYLETFIRILRVQNVKYKVLKQDVASECLIKTFENIYVGASVEGGSVFTICDENTPEHIKDFKTNSILTRYIWIYIMAIVQRETALTISHSVGSPKFLEMLLGNESKIDIESLFKEYNRLNILKLYAYFPDVSYISHINKFYDLCVRSFRIKEYVESVDDKLNGIRSVIERWQDIYERNRDKAEKYQAKLERRNEMRLNNIILFLTLFTLISVINDLSSYFNLYYDENFSKWKWSPILSAILGGVAIVLGLIYLYLTCKKDKKS